MKTVSILTVLLISVLTLFVQTACESLTEASLSVQSDSLVIPTNGGVDTLIIKTDAAGWVLSNPAAPWIQLSATTGTGPVDTVFFTVNETVTSTRTATLQLTAEGAKPVNVVVFQPFHSLASNINRIDSKKSGGSSSFAIVSSAPWTLSCDVPWLNVSATNGEAGTHILSVTIAANDTGEDRVGRINVQSLNGPSLSITVSQIGLIFPSYNTNPLPPDITGMPKTALQLAALMYAGWNLGNSLEVPADETAWGNERASQRLIDSIYAAGFNTVRLPCAWNSHMIDANTARLNPAWLARVKEVVDYCYTHGMYVILNIHWDGGWLENRPFYWAQEEVNAKQKAFWEQIATHFRDYDEHLLFAGTNEVHADYGTPTNEHHEVFFSYLRTFIDAVRSTGGRNSYRNLVIQTYNTNIDYGVNYLRIPTDQAKNRLFIEVHYYDPWDFCGDETASAKTLWGQPFAQYGNVSSWGQESHVLSQFNKVKQTYVDKGYPVILGEYAPTRRSALTGDALTRHLASRAYYLSYVTEKAKTYGLIPCYWDNGGRGNLASGIFYRGTGATFDHQALQALQEGAANGQYPF